MMPQQIECVNNAVAGGYQAIIVAANGPDAISSALKEAKDAGIKIVYVDSPGKRGGRGNLLHRQRGCRYNSRK